jgi:hypothetical protein
MTARGQEEVKAISLALLVTAAAALSGCDHYAARPAFPTGDLSYLSAPIAPPRIIPGQKAQLNGYHGMKEAWESTGLFTAVEYTSSTVPTAQGIYIKSSCSYSSSLSGLGTLGALTLFVLPAQVWDYDRTCQTSLYQNGQLLLTDSVAYRNRELGATWFLFPLLIASVKVPAENQQTQAGLVVRHMLVELGKRNPQ